MCYLKGFPYDEFQTTKIPYAGIPLKEKKLNSKFYKQNHDNIVVFFRAKDIGRPKAKVAAEFINKRIPSCNVTPYLFYKAFFV